MNNLNNEVELQLVMPVTHDAARLYRQMSGTSIPEAIQFVLAQRIGGGGGEGGGTNSQAVSQLLFDAIDTIMGGGTGNFNMNQITAPNARPENVNIDPETVSAWNLLDIVRESFLIHRRQSLPLEVSIVLGVMMYHRRHGFEQVSEEDVRFWFNLVNIALGGGQQDDEGYSNASFPSIQREVMRNYFPSEDKDTDDDDTPGNTAGAA